MAEILGRKVTITIDGTAKATARTKSLSINNEPVDVTSDTDTGIQRFLAEPGQKSVEISVEGMFDAADETLQTLALNSTDVIVPVVLNYTTYTITGDFFMSSYSDNGAYNDAVAFSATFQSSGAVVKAAVV